MTTDGPVTRSDRALWTRLVALFSWRTSPEIRRARRSVRGKVMAVVLATVALALTVEGAAMLTHDLRVYRDSAFADLETEASILALATAPTLAFDDRNGADRNLAALKARPALLAAGLYDDRGRLYAQYTEKGADPPGRQQATPTGITRLNGETIEVTRKVVLNGKVLGTVYLRAHFDVRGRIVTYLGIFALVMLLSMIVAFAVSSILQKGITDPLEDMADVARAIVTDQDYSLRAKRAPADEIGLVVQAFNRMLDEVEARARALEQSNSALKAEAGVRQAAEVALGRATARLESTMAAAEIGSWVWDLRSNQLTADRNLAALLGVEDEKQLGGDPAVFRKHIHADDLASVVAAEAEALRTGVLSSTEFRVVRTDGTLRWVSSRGKFQIDTVGHPILFAGLLIDISGQKAAEGAVRESERLYRAIGESMDYGVWVCDSAGRNIYASDSFLRLVGVTQAQCSDLGWGDLLHPDDQHETMAAWMDCVHTGRFWYREHRIRGTDGRYHPVLAQGVPIRDEKGQITGWAGINLDISRLKVTEEALREADRRKDEFLATLAHELRNPLAPIRHAVRLLEAPSAAERDRQWGREVIARQVQRMALLLDDLLDVSRITSGRLELKKDYVELGPLVASAVETARPLIESKQHTLDVNLPDAPVEMLVDPLRLSQALSNLLTNAAKYTDPGGRIGLSVEIQPEAVEFTVTDNGIGFSQSLAPRLFEMFAQVDSAIDRGEGGLGIGLALVRGLVALHGGGVTASSDGHGKGSQFRIRLPRSVVVVRESLAIPATAAAGHTAPVGCKVVVADDNRDAADSLAMVLTIAGYQVSVAYDGREALALGERDTPEIAILDIGMPGLTGYDAARRIRQHAWGREALLIAITGWGQEHDKESTRAAGFDHHLTKPVDPAVVEGLLREFLAKRGSAVERAGRGLA